MRKLFCTVFMFLPSVVFSDSLLTVQSFPKTFNDLSFTDRVNVLTDGYLPFETVFDSSGRCISGCPYAGITFQEVKDITNAAEQAAEQDIQYQEQQNNVQPKNNINYGQNYNNSVVSNTSYSLVPIGLPLRGTNNITSCYKIRWNRPHNGIDIIGSSAIYSVGEGTVEQVVNGCIAGNTKCGGGYGNYVLIKHNDTYKTRYAHLSSVNVKKGDRVTQNTQIGTMGNTGHSFGKHLHFEILRLQSGNYVQINPRKINPSGYQISDDDCNERDD